MPRYEDLVPALLDELDHALHSVAGDDVERLKQAILAAQHIFVCGKGRSGLHMRAFAMRLMHLGLPAFVVDDVTTPAIGAGDLLVIGSGSGHTASLVGYAQRAKSLGAQVALVTASLNSPLRTLADVIVRIEAASPKVDPAGQMRSFQPMANLFEQSLGLVLDMTTIVLMADLNKTEAQMFARHANLE